MDVKNTTSFSTPSAAVPRLVAESASRDSDLKGSSTIGLQLLPFSSQTVQTVYGHAKISTGPNVMTVITQRASPKLVLLTLMAKL